MKNKAFLITILLCLSATFIFLVPGCNNSTDVKDKTSAEEKIKNTETASSESQETGQNGGTKDEGSVNASEDSYSLLYQLSRHKVITQQMGNEECHSFIFYEFLDGGMTGIDGKDNMVLKLEGYPTSLVRSESNKDFFYISSENNPVSEISGFSFFNWDVEGQNLYASGYEEMAPEVIVRPDEKKFPGGFILSPDNGYIVYLLTAAAAEASDFSGGFMINKFNPFLNDSDLIIKDMKEGKQYNALQGLYNRQLFSSFACFSKEGDFFYTIKKQGEGFSFTGISMENGQLKDFADLFPGFDWNNINWSEFFPESDDFSYAYFFLSPDGQRLAAFKNKYSADLSNPCYTDSIHKLWVFNLIDGSTEIIDNLEGYASDITWEPDGQKFAVAVMGHCGCYPDYLDAKINIFDRDANFIKTLVYEDKNKITNIAWSPDGKMIAYDTYGTDLTGRLKFVQVQSGEVSEVVNTDNINIDYEDNDDPVTILLSGWIKD